MGGKGAGENVIGEGAGAGAGVVAEVVAGTRSPVRVRTAFLWERTVNRKF